MIDEKYDPLGHAVKEYYLTGTAGELIVESDISETDEIPVPYFFRSFGEMPLIEQEALKVCRGKVLDAGAAAGSHSLWLQENGLRTTALDFSSLACETMLKRGIKDVRCLDFFNIKDTEKYDTLLLLMNGAGLAGTLQGLTGFLEHCMKLIKTDGQVLIDSSDIQYIFDSPDEMPEYYYGEVNYQMFYRNIYSRPFNWLFVDFETLRITAASQGFNCVKIIDGSENDYLAKISFL